MNIAIVGAGWAGMAAAVLARDAGHQVTVFEAARALGGRARGLEATLPDGSTVILDNGQHILIGAYTETLALMEKVGVRAQDALLRLPLTLQFPDGDGIKLPNWPSPLDALAGIVQARGWSGSDKWSLLRRATGWQLGGFRCDAQTTVAELCAGLTPAVRQTLIDPLCVSALNTPADQASGAVFLRVLKDSLFAGSGSSNLLLPRIDLGAMFPQAAADWLQQRGGSVHTGTRVHTLQRTPHGWQVNGEAFDTVIWATASAHAAPVLAALSSDADVAAWLATTEALHYEAITTVYTWADNVRLRQPMLALRNTPTAPAQFVFDRGQLNGPAGLLAWVVSASVGERAQLEAQVLQQARDQLGLESQVLQTVVEKRATFACTPALQRPATRIAPGLLACGDYVDGPYPATLEGAVRSAQHAISLLETA